jgi:kinetochore protein NDC80
MLMLLITLIVGYKAEQDALHADHVGDVQKQNLTPEDVERMKTDKETLSKAVEELRTKINESSKSMWDRELALAKRSDTVEQLVGDYMNLAYNTSMHPTPPPPFESINFALELNLATSNPRDMLKTNIRDTIKPALMAVVESKRQERAKVEDERVKTEDELDRIIQEADNVKEEINAVAHRLQVIQEQAEDVKTVCISPNVPFAYHG